MLQLFGVDKFQLAREAVFSRVSIQLPHIRIGHFFRLEIGGEGNVRNKPPVLLKDLRQYLTGLASEC